jgi:transcriptional regulator with XRE-family HTH domain
MKVFLPDSPIAEPFMTKFYAKLVALMEVRNLVPATLAKVAGVDKQKISRWKTGTLPAIDDALRVAKTLGVPLDFLADDEMESPPEANAGRTDIETWILETLAAIGPNEMKRRVLQSERPVFGDHTEASR